MTRGTGRSASRGVLLMTGAMTISGTIGWFVLAAGQAPVDIVFWRCAFAIVALLVASLKHHSVRHSLSSRDAPFAILGGLAMMSTWLLLFEAYRHSSIAVATSVYNVQPFILLAFGAIFLGETITFGKVLWLAVGFAGLLLISQIGIGDLSAEQLTGIALALGAAFCWALSTLMTKRLAKVWSYTIALVHVCVGAIVLAPLVDWHHLPSDMKIWAYLGTIGIVHTGLVYVMIYEAVQRLSTPVQGVLSFIYPIVAIMVDVVILHRQLEVSQVFGVIAILIAAAAISIGPGRK